MRKLVTLLAIMVSTLGIVGGAGASTASAANCTFLNSPYGFTNVVYGTWHGYPEWSWSLLAGNCSGVNAVQFETVGAGHAYMVDVNPGTVHFSNSGGGIAGNINGPESPGTYYGTYFNNIWGPGCGFGSFPIYKRARARIHNVARGGSWGAWYDFTSLTEAIC